MDIFIRNIAVSSTKDQLTDFFRPILRKIAVVSFNCQKIKGKGWAILTIGDTAKAMVFLDQYGLPADPLPNARPKNTLFFTRRPMTITPGRNSPSEYHIRALELEEKKILEKQKQTAAVPRPKKKRHANTFDFLSLSCGSWAYDRSVLTFNPYLRDVRTGSIIFGKSSLVILLKARTEVPWTCRLDISYFSIVHILTGAPANPTVAITLSSPPKIYDDTSDLSGPDNLVQGMNRLSLGSPRPKQQTTRTRLFGIDKNHADVVSFCLVYHMVLSNPTAATTVHSLLNGSSSMPETIYFPTPMKVPRRSFMDDFRLLNNKLSDYTQLRSLNFGLRFQIQKLVQNAFLPPGKVLGLLPEIEKLVETHGQLKITVAVRRLASVSQALSPGPDVEARDFEIKELVRLIEENASQFFREGSIYDLARRHEHLALIHKVTVTPCALLLGGPEPEVTNRVLRQYSTHTDYFIRVTFADEDGELIRFDGRASQHKIFHERFKSVLDNGVNIAGRRFTFLGFSHSSLRSQTCWFMAPIMRTGVDLVMAERVIKQLGDFTSIRSPAKCAARIGQAFSDTTGSVPIQPEALVRIPDIERNGRTFSDGCGTISETLLKKVWRGYALGRGLKPTTLQIRFAGAKGVISLDTTLSGNMLCLRPSMTKFNAAYLDIEICGGAMRPLPLYLNRGFIKILEDLGVEPEVFLDLQAAMVEKLRMITLTPPNAATFLEWCRVGSAAKTPQLIRLLDDIGLPFQQDSFLKDTVEIAALSQLREIKHRSRILVENGMTLFGIMDETNTLNEGEIYAVSEKVDSNGQWQRFVLTGGEVAITRSPALHPGDIQIVQAVDVPSDSPLAKLRNCVVFSQKGDRDLPSQLSGGDLDGDLYNIIFDPLLMPKKTHHPADYPRQDPIDIGRPVEREDMTEFFIQFMETDQLGRISMMHLQMADREGEGTLHPTCIKLAGMASTAVDFSKTGIPVDMNGFPKQDYLRPDFMATGPRVIVEKRGAVFNDDDDGEEEDEKDPVSAMDPDGKSYRYYESNKVLGRLYRAIDEKAFFEQMQKDSKCLASRDPTRRSLMDKLWDYVRREAALVQWREYAGLAKESREAYESNLLETMDQYSIHHAHPLRELEVFSGSILGKSIGAQNRRIREMTAEMKDRFERDVTFIVDRITQGDDGDKDEALARSIACLANAMLEPGHGKRMHLQSWKYIAAAICLRELERFQGGLLRRI